MPKFRKAKLLILFLLLFLFLGASFIYAQKPLEITYPEIPGVTAPTITKTALPDYIRYVFQFSLFLGALIALSSFVYGGVRYLTSAGSPSGIKDAKSQISAGILGLIILISAYLILNTINPQLVAWEVSLPGRAPGALPTAGLPKLGPPTYFEIPIGGLIENLFCKNAEGEVETSPCSRERLNQINYLAKEIQEAAKELKEPIEELKKLYSCSNCCQDCCKNVCDWAECSEICELDEKTGNWKNCPLGNLCCEGTQIEGCWQNCGAYSCCEGRIWEHHYLYKECRFNCCEFFQPCRCENCEECICVRPDGDCCNPEDPDRHYEDPIVKALLEEIGIALKNLRLKIGLLSLIEELKKEENLGDWLSEEESKNLIENLLIGIPLEKDKLKEVLKNTEVLEYLVEREGYRNELFNDKNAAKTAMKILDFLKNEVAINEISWMGTQADSNHEWIELYNNTQGSINLEGWELKAKDGSPTISLSGAIPAQGFYLLETEEEAISDITADLIYSGELEDGGEILEIYDQFGNLIDKVNCPTRWFAGDENSKTSMERINPKEESNFENWATNFSIKVGEENKEDFINGKDKDGNPIYGTPKNPNSAGVSIISYPSLNNLLGELKERLRYEEGLREKLMLLLKKGGTLEKLLISSDTQDAFKNLLTGDDTRFKTFLKIEGALRILLEKETNLSQLLADSHTEEVFRKILKMEKDEDWEEFKANLDQARENLKLINDFKRDLAWVNEASSLMRNCLEPPISFDQKRSSFEEVNEEYKEEWLENIETIVQVNGNWIEDPSLFYCHKRLW